MSLCLLVVKFMRHLKKKTVCSFIMSCNAQNFSHKWDKGTESISILDKIFTAIVCIGVARNFDWEGPKPQITCNDVITNFQKRNFSWGKDTLETNIRSCGLFWHLSRI